MNYDKDKILLACDIIDTLSIKLKELQNDDNVTKISDSIIQKINEQYQSFILKKDKITNHLSETINMIKELELSELNSILCSKFASIKLTNNTIYKCTKCNQKEFLSMRSLSNHKRSCIGNKLSDDSSNDIHVDSPTNIQVDSPTNIQVDSPTNIEVDSSKKSNKRKVKKSDVV